MKKSELESYIRSVIKEELKRTLDARVGILIAELVDELVKDRLNEIISALGSQPRLVESRRPVRDVEETVSPRPPIDRTSISRMLGYDSPPSMENSVNPSEFQSSNRGSEITVDFVIGNDDSGTPRPIDPRAVPEEFKKAINRDYRSFLKKLNENTSRSRGGA